MHVAFYGRTCACMPTFWLVVNGFVEDSKNQSGHDCKAAIIEPSLFRLTSYPDRTCLSLQFRRNKKRRSSHSTSIDVFVGSVFAPFLRLFDVVLCLHETNCLGNWMNTLRQGSISSRCILCRTWGPVFPGHSYLKHCETAPSSWIVPWPCNWLRVLAITRILVTSVDHETERKDHTRFCRNDTIRLGGESKT